MGISRPWEEKREAKKRSIRREIYESKGGLMRPTKKRETYINIEDNNFACSNRVLTHVQEQYITLQRYHIFNTIWVNKQKYNEPSNNATAKLKSNYPLKTGFHASRENNHHRRFASGDTHQSFPYDQSRCHNHSYKISTRRKNNFSDNFVIRLVFKTNNSTTMKLLGA